MVEMFFTRPTVLEFGTRERGVLTCDKGVGQAGRHLPDKVDGVRARLSEVHGDGCSSGLSFFMFPFLRMASCSCILYELTASDFGVVFPNLPR